MLSRPVQICFNPFYKSRLKYITIFCPNDPFKNNAVIAKNGLVYFQLQFDEIVDLSEFITATIIDT